MLPVGALLGVVLEHVLASRCGGIAGGEAFQLRVRDAESGIGHTQRPEDPLLEVGVERFATDRFNQVAADIGRDRIVPGRAGGEEQRQLRQFLDARRQRLVLRAGPGLPRGAKHSGTAALHHPQLPVRGIDRVADVETIRQAALMGEDIPHAHRPLRRLRDEVRPGAGQPDAEPLPRRNELVHRVIQLESALFIEHHQRD